MDCGLSLSVDENGDRRFLSFCASLLLFMDIYSWTYEGTTREVINHKRERMSLRSHRRVLNFSVVRRGSNQGIRNKRKLSCSIF